MLVAALAATVAVALAADQQRWLADVGNRRDQVQAQSLALAGVQWARQILADDARSGTLDHLGEPWAYPLPPTPIANGSIEGRIEDAQGRLNLNNLALDGAAGHAERDAPRAAPGRQGCRPQDARRDRRLGRRRRDRASERRRGRVVRAAVARRRSPPTRRSCAPPRSRRSAARAREGVGRARRERRRAAGRHGAQHQHRARRRDRRRDSRPRRRQARRVHRRSRAQAVHDDARNCASACRAASRCPKAASFAFASSYFLVSVRSRQGDAIAQARALLKRDGREWPVGRLADARIDARRVHSAGMSTHFASLSTAAPSPARDDAVGAVRRAGAPRRSRARDPRRRGPSADRREAVLAAGAVRLVVVALPPMPADRVAAAAAFALEDQLAGPGAGAASRRVGAPARRQRRRRHRARALIAPLPEDVRARRRRAGGRAGASAAGAWRWYALGDPPAVSCASPTAARSPSARRARSGPVPAGARAAAARRRTRTAARGPRIEVAFAVRRCAAARMVARNAALPFARAAAWRWDQDGAALAAAPDLLQGEFSRAPARGARERARARFRWAAGLAVAALVLHVGATFVAVGVAALRGLAGGRARSSPRRATPAPAKPPTPMRPRRRADADTLPTRAIAPGLTAPADALPLLARAAPALAALPAGALKTRDLRRRHVDLRARASSTRHAQTALDRGLAAAGARASLHGDHRAGTRMRVDACRPGRSGRDGAFAARASPALAGAWDRASPRERALIVARGRRRRARRAVGSGSGSR